MKDFGKLLFDRMKDAENLIDASAIAFEVLMEQKGEFEKLEIFKTTHLGLWATDRPDEIPYHLKPLFWEIKGD
jgi:hypothetical protein